MSLNSPSHNSFTKILIANRGEIACRVIRTARKMGISTVAVYSDADANALHVSMADEAIYLGGSSPAESYLNADLVIDAALKANAQAIHPGYGFLSENAAFSERCAKEGLTFIGPPADAIISMGSKSAAKKIMEAADVPLLGGYHDDDQTPAVLKSAAATIGYPVLLKAVAGGGGKGMRQVHSEAGFDEALDAAKREAINGFGNADMLVEKFLLQPRHVEVQVFFDTAGNGVYLFERDCSVQRRHQKIIEEAPAPGLTPELRERMGQAALRAAAAVNYVGAGTVEFLLDAAGEFYFMEMNTRLQVEHPVTEMITAQDLVEWQIRIAAGENLPVEQSDLHIHGHAFEARIYAEDPDNEFLPAAGTVAHLQQPLESDTVRVDTGVICNDEVGVFYDPMIAKLIVWGETRSEARMRLLQALGEYQIVGMTTNIEFLKQLAAHEAFSAGDVSTDFIDRHAADLFASSGLNQDSLAPLSALYLTLANHVASDVVSDPTSPWHATDHWRTNSMARFSVSFLDGDKQYDLGVETTQATQTDLTSTYRVTHEDKIWRVTGKIEGTGLHANIDGHQVAATIVEHQNQIHIFSREGLNVITRTPVDLGEETTLDDGTGFKAPMNGTMVDVLVQAGDQVASGDTLVIMEAMKMEHAVTAPTNGRIVEIYFGKGDLVDGGADLLSFEPEAGE